MRRAAATLAALLVVGACRSPVGGDRSSQNGPSGGRGQPHPALGAEPSPLGPDGAPPAASTAPSASGAAQTATKPVSTPASTTTSRHPTDDQTASASAPLNAYRTFAEGTDARGDDGLEGPDYSDIVGVVLQDNGQHLRVGLQMGAELPARLGDGEVEGIALDLYQGGPESEYQLFADGGADGWRAYLQTPHGFVSYPGTFAIAGSQVIFVVPWSAVGGRRPGQFGALSDWSQRRAPLNASAQDMAPDIGTTPYSPP